VPDGNGASSTSKRKKPVRRLMPRVGRNKSRKKEEPPVSWLPFSRTPSGRNIIGGLAADLCGACEYLSLFAYLIAFKSRARCKSN
jgi:hypothetical protein